MSHGNSPCVVGPRFYDWTHPSTLRPSATTTPYHKDRPPCHSRFRDFRLSQGDRSRSSAPWSTKPTLAPTPGRVRSGSDTRCTTFLLRSSTSRPWWWRWTGSVPQVGTHPDGSPPPVTPIPYVYSRFSGVEVRGTVGRSTVGSVSVTLVRLRSRNGDDGASRLRPSKRPQGSGT